MSNITVTGNEAQFNEKVTFLKEVDFQSNIEIKGTLTVPPLANLTVDNLTVSNIFGNPNVTFNDEVTFLDTVNFADALSFTDLEIRDRFAVGVGGTVLVADSRLNPGKVGIGSTQPTELLDVGGKAKIIDLDLRNLYVAGFSTFVGISSFQDNVIINGDAEARFGGSPSLPGLKIYNNNAYTYFTSTDSVIFNSLGSININGLTNNNLQSNNNRLITAGGVEIIETDTTTAYLKHSGTTKLHTTGIGVSVLGDLIVPDVGGRVSRVGLGTTFPANPLSIAELNDAGEGELRLDVKGSISVSRNIYDSSGSPGANNYWLRRDELGIKWVALTPGFDEGIFIQDEGQFLPTDENHQTVGAAQSFTTINFVQRNSFGLGTDTLRPTAADPTAPGTGLATIFTNDLWGHNGTGDNASLYRMSNVGIRNNSPTYTLDITGTLHATQHVEFDSTLNVDGDATFQSNVTINADNKFFKIQTDGNADKFTVDTNTGNTDIKGTLNVDGATTLNNTLDVDLATTLNDTLDVTGRTNFNNTDDASNSTSGGSVTIDGGAAVAKKLFVGSDFDVDGDTTLDKLTVDELATFNDNIDANQNLDVDGDTTLDKLTVDELATFNDDIDANKKLDVDGDTTLDKLTVDELATFNDDIDANKKLDVDGDTTLDKLTVDELATFNDDIDANQNLDVDGHTELDDLNVTGVSTFGPGITTQTSRLFAKDLEVAGLSTFIGITTQKSTLFATQFNVSGFSTFHDDVEIDAQLNVTGVSTFKETVDLDGPLKDINDDTGTSVAASLSGNITGANYNSTTGIMEITIANHGFENGDSIKIPDGTIKLSCNYKGVTISQSYPRSKDPNSGKWLVISNKTTDTFEVNVGDGGLAAGVAHSFVSATGGVIHSSGQYVKDDYRLASVGTGVSWRPSGVQTKRTIWVTKNGSDTNSGLLEGDAKATIGAAAAVALPTDTIKIRPGVYEENNPIGLRTDVSVTGEDLRLVIIKSKNPLQNMFHVRRGCLIENLNFGGSNVGVSHDGAACVAFPPPSGSTTGFTDPGPANEGPSGRWRSPYVRNCTNFMTGSIGMKIDGNHANGAFTGINSVGADLKSMVCDSFTQYNENGIGVSLTNNGYAQLVSIFTINTDIGIYADTGAQCDLTNSNSSFGNFGLVAVGLGSTQFTGIVSNTNSSGEIIASTNPEQQDTVVAAGVTDSTNEVRTPFDGQALYFKINTNNYPEINVTNNPNVDPSTGRITKPLERLSSVKLRNVDLSGFSPLDPPDVLIVDSDDNSLEPKGPQGIIAEATATVSPAGVLTEINVVAQGRNYLAGQNLVVDIEGDRTLADPIMEPIYFTVESATPVMDPTGITTITFNEFIPYELFPDDPFELQRISRILTSSHSFEYVGTGTDINIATPLQGAIPIKANEVVAKDGAQIPFTSTDQKGNFDIGKGLQINQTTSTISGRDFSRSLQAEVTPLILALR